ncbi:MAG: type 1 glutamine amidotransferase [Oscillospiraceae bacterium]|jgi:putative glutamine amidotransferase|nr:type 1 glutamine amidotransferase [Oscillospiraceae bacterium]
MLVRPRILLMGGLGQTETGAPYVRLPRAYADAVWRAGGLPACACAPDDAADHARAFAGLLLTGGEDPDPAAYGQTVLNDTVQADRARDDWERALFEAFCAAGRPVLGICRGIQAINVFLGGTLIQDLPAQRGLCHSGVTHMVRAAPGGFPHALFGARFPTNSAHHQAVDRPGGGLIPTAWADDGVIEAVEGRDAPVWGVQWHPERMGPGDPALPGHGRLFERFVTRCAAD